MSTTCFCEQFHLKECGLQKTINIENTLCKCQHFKGKWPQQTILKKKDMKKLNDVKSRIIHNCYSEKPLICCEALEGIHCSKKDVESSIKDKANAESETNITEKIEIYYFDHGNSAYYHTTDIVPILTTEKVIEKTNSNITKIFAELFGFFHLIVSIFTTCILQSLRFILFSFIRPLTVGVIQLVADYFVKPLLSITFNGLIQPILILLYNMATSIRDCCEPVATTFEFYVKEIAILLGSCRLIEITQNYKSNPST